MFSFNSNAHKHTYTSTPVYLNSVIHTTLCTHLAQIDQLRAQTTTTAAAASNASNARSAAALASTMSSPNHPKYKDVVLESVLDQHQVISSRGPKPRSSVSERNFLSPTVQRAGPGHMAPKTSAVDGQHLRSGVPESGAVCGAGSTEREGRVEARRASTHARTRGNERRARSLARTGAHNETSRTLSSPSPSSPLLNHSAAA